MSPCTSYSVLFKSCLSLPSLFIVFLTGKEPKEYLIVRLDMKKEKKKKHSGQGEMSVV